MAVPSTAPSETSEVRLRDLRASEATVAIIARVVLAEHREVTRRADGGRRPVLSGLLSDGTATVRFTWWDPPKEGIERGTVLRAANVQVREFRGRPELSFNFRTRVEPASELELPHLDAAELPLRPLRELVPQMEGFRLEARVVRVQPKTVSVGEEQRQLHEGTLADGSGAVAFTAWSDFSLRPGEAVRVAGAYVRGFRGRAQLVLDERAHLERIPGDGLPTAEELERAGPTSIAAVESLGGGDLLTVEGRVVALLPPSGLVYRCPSCRRAVSKGLCRTHGSVTGVPDLRARLVLDDGTAPATVNAGRAETERLWGRTLDEALGRLRDQPDPTLLEEELFEAVFGRRLRVRGRATRDDFGLTFFPESVEEVVGDPRSAAEELGRRLTEAA